MNVKLSFVRSLAMGVAVVAIALTGVSSASAAEYITPDEDGNAVVSASETHRNLYVVGTNVSVNSPTQGDLYTAGGNVSVDGTVEQDLTAAGGTLYINEAVGGDIRIAGGTVTINAPVAGDVVVAGGSVRISEKASVGGDVLMAGGQLTIDGPVTGKVNIAGDTVIINNTIGGEFSAKVAKKIVFGSSAKLSSGKYVASQQAEVRDGAQLGSVTYEEMKNGGHRGAGAAMAGFATMGFVIKLLALIATALLLNRLFPRTSSNLVRHTGEHFWSNAGIGLLAIIVAPILAIISMVILVGLYAGIILLMTWLLALVLSGLVGMVFAGSWITKKLSKKTELTIDWQAIVIGVVVVTLVALVPVIGWLIMAILALAGFGAIVRGLYHTMRHDQGGEIVVVENN